MDWEIFLHFLSWIFMIISFAILAYMGLKVRKLNKRLTSISLLFASFTLIHSFYHLSEVLHYDYVADVFFNPLSVIALLIFGLYYWRETS